MRRTAASRSRTAGGRASWRNPPCGRSWSPRCATTRCRAIGSATGRASCASATTRIPSSARGARCARPATPTIRPSRVCSAAPASNRALLLLLQCGEGACVEHDPDLADLSVTDAVPLDRRRGADGRLRNEVVDDADVLPVRKDLLLLCSLEQATTDAPQRRELAKRVALSRSAFSARFRELTGES